MKPIISVRPGNRYHKWLVLERDFTRSDSSHHTFWRCRCACGAERIVSSSNLVTGTSKTCGCSHLQHPHPGRPPSLANRLVG